MSRAAIRISPPHRSGPRSAFIAASGAAVSMLRGILNSILPLLAGGTLLILACCLAATGIRRFYGQDMSWRLTAAVTGFSFAGLTFFIAVVDHMPMRIFIYSLAMSIPMAMTLKLLAVAEPRPRQSRRPACRHHRDPDPRHQPDPRRRRAAAYRRRSLFVQLQRIPGGADPAFGVPVDGVEFRLRADGDRPAARRGRRSGAARRSHRRRQPPPAAAPAGSRNARSRSAPASRLRSW